MIYPERSFHALSNGSSKASAVKGVPFGEVAGRTPSGIPAYSNGSDTHFSNKEAVVGHVTTGFEWQCVEFARRWLLQAKGVLLPDIHIAAHIIYITKMLHMPSRSVIVPKPVYNGGFEKPEANSLIIYPMSKHSFVGHVGVITEVGDTFVRVADQNRYFHSWGEDTYSCEYALERNAAGQWRIRDDDTECIGWVTFPGIATRPPVREGQCGNDDLNVPAHITGGNKLTRWRYARYWMRSVAGYVGISKTFRKMVPPVVLQTIEDDMPATPAEEPSYYEL